MRHDAFICDMPHQVCCLCGCHQRGQLFQHVHRALSAVLFFECIRLSIVYTNLLWLLDQDWRIVDAISRRCFECTLAPLLSLSISLSHTRSHTYVQARFLSIFLSPSRSLSLPLHSSLFSLSRARSHTRYYRLRWASERIASWTRSTPLVRQ